jgi:hypothetical protein
MELRNHPMMLYKGARNWPPHWRCISSKEPRVVDGEIGVLEKVARGKRKIVLYIENEGEIYEGSVHFDDPHFCNRVYELLKVVCGYPIAFIGGRDVND